MAATKIVPITALRDHLSGQVIGPSDSGYDDARQLFAGNFDKRPSAIVRPVDAGEVSRLVKLAAEAPAVSWRSVAGATAAPDTAAQTEASSWISRR